MTESDITCEEAGEGLYLRSEISVHRMSPRHWQFMLPGKSVALQSLRSMLVLVVVVWGAPRAQVLAWGELPGFNL